MKKNLFVKRSAYVLTATALLVSTGWAQPPPKKDPRKPIETGPQFETPIDPRLPLIVSPPTIESPRDDGYFDLDKPLVISGKGMSGARVHITIKSQWTEKYRGKDLLKGRTVSEPIVHPTSRGDWKTQPLKLSAPTKSTSLKFEITAVQNVGNKTSRPTTITIRPSLKIMEYQPIFQGTIAPMLSITSPKNGAKVTSPILVEGTASGAEQVDVTVRVDITTKKPGKMALTSYFTGFANAVPVKNGRWSTRVDVATDKKNITKINYLITATMKHPKGTLEKDVRATRG